MYNLYSMARQDWLLRQHPGSVTVRFEDLRHHFNATVARMMHQLGFLPDASRAEPLLSELQECDPGTWKGERRKKSSHITAGKVSNKERLRSMLLAQPDLSSRFCSLCTSLGYATEGICKGTGAAAAGGAGVAASGGMAEAAASGGIAAAAAAGGDGIVAARDSGAAATATM